MPIGKILCIGDSLTAGDEANVTGYRSYRGALQLLLQNAGYTVDFVGTQSSTPATGGNDPQHDGYGGARMDSSDSAANSIEGRVATIRAAVGAVDIIILLIGWNDVYQSTATAATKYSDLLLTIRAGTWASAKIVMVTLSPEPNKTAAQTGSDYPVYSQINTQIRAEVDANHIVADLAALAGTADVTAMVNTLLYDAQNGPDFLVTGAGGQLPALYGGHEHTSFKSIQDLHAQWSSTPAWPRVGGNGGTPSGNAQQDARMFHPDPSLAGHPIFVNTARCVVPWFWTFTGPGHNASNTGLEVRNAFAQAWRADTNQWEFFFEGARMGGDWASYVDAPWGPSDGAGTVNQWRGDGITTIIKPTGNIGVEVWPEDTVPSRGILKFLGGANRAAMANAKCFIVGAQVRLALVDPNGTNDISRAVLQACMGMDFFADNGYLARYDYYGWSLSACDGGKDRWKRITSTDWVWIGSVAIGNGADGHFEDPGLKPPIGRNWSPATPYNDIPAYSVTAAQIRANPPRMPQYVSGATTGATSAWIPTDYWYNPSLSGLDIHWSQQGADRAAQTIYNAMVQAGWLTGFTGGTPVAASLLPGIARTGTWGARYTTEATDPDKAAWVSTAVTQTGAPAWPEIGSLPAAVVGTYYQAPVRATGTPAPTYSIISGAPGWMSLLQGATRNRIRNTRAVGAVAGTPGTMPTNWSSIPGSTLSSQVVGAGIDSDGLEYLDLRIFGTNTSGSTQFPGVYFETATQIAAVNNQQWSGSVHVMQIAGPNPLSSVSLSMHEGNSSGTFLRSVSFTGSALPTTGTLSAARRSGTVTTNQPTVAFVRLLLAMTVTNGQTVDFTMRIARPQIEQSAAVNAWVDPAASYLIGTPTGGATTHSITLRASNGISPNADTVVPLQVNVGVAITTTSIPTPVVGQAYFFQFTATGTETPTWSLASGTLPAGLTFSSSGVLSGTPTTATGYTFTPRATVSTGSATQAITTTVTAAASPPVITTTSLTDATTGVAYSMTLAATGGTPISWAIVSGSLPLGVSLNGTTGAITGTPTVFGIFPITVRATNSFNSVTKDLFLLVIQAGLAVTAPVSPWAKFLR